MPTSVNEQLDALVRARDAHFGTSSHGCTVKPLLDAAFAIVALADEHVLGGTATADMAMATVKMLAGCVMCKGPSVTAAAFDQPNRWFDISSAFCAPCYSQYIERKHSQSTERHGTYYHDDDRSGDGSVSDYEEDDYMYDVGRKKFDDQFDESSYDDESCDCDTNSNSDADSNEVGIENDGDPHSVVSDGDADGSNDDGGEADSALPICRDDAVKTIKRLMRRGEARPLHIDFSMFWRPVRKLSHGNAIAYSPDCATIATGSEGGVVRLWDVASGKCCLLLKGRQNCVFLSALAFSPDGIELAIGDHDMIGTVRLRDTQSGRRVGKLQGHSELITAVMYSRDGTSIASGSKDLSVRLWDAALCRCRRVLRTDNAITAVALSPDGAWVAAGGQGPTATVQVWNAESGACRHTQLGERHHITAVAFSPDGATIAALSSQFLQLWDSVSGACRRILPHSSSMSGLAFSPDGGLIATGTGDEIWLLDSVTLQCRRVLRGHGGGVEAVAFSPDGTKIVASEHIRTGLELWDLQLARNKMRSGVVVVNETVEPEAIVAHAGHATALPLKCHRPEARGI